VLVAACASAGGGPLVPPAGPIAPTQKPLAEIEPRIAINNANTPGDSDSLFRITNSGSYYLTGNIDGKSTVKCIEIFAAGGAQITIDLNGFTITGLSDVRSESAIFIDGDNAHVAIRNGTIRNWKSAVEHFIGGSVTLEDVRAYRSLFSQYDVKNATMVRCLAEDGGSTGFNVGGGLLVDCSSINNTGAGFTILNASTTLRGCVATSNDGGGFDLGQGVAESCRAEGNSGNGFTHPGVMTNCIANGNTNDGISASFSATIRGCTVVDSGAAGIRVAVAGRIEGNTISLAGEHGIEVAGSRITVVNNTISSAGRNTGSFAGVFVAGTDCSIDGNHVTNMTLGGDDFGIRVTGTSNLIVRNQLSGLSTYFSIGASNTSGGASTTPSTAGPWANITY
jgi:hypothetical protein